MCSHSPASFSKEMIWSFLEGLRGALDGGIKNSCTFISNEVTIWFWVSASQLAATWWCLLSSFFFGGCVYEFVVLILSSIFFSAADVLLWKRKHVSCGTIAVATVAWILFEQSGLSFLSICSDVLLILIVVLFLRANYAAFRNKYGFSILYINWCSLSYHCWNLFGVYHCFYWADIWIRYLS